MPWGLAEGAEKKAAVGFKKQSLMQQFIFITFVFLFSCNYQENNSQWKNVSKDTSRFIPLLKSYEPKQYKGKIPSGFYTYHGFRDWWRFPLVYPYSICCINEIRYGNITSDKGKVNFEAGSTGPVLTDYFDEFIFDKNIFVGKKIKKDTNKYDEEYFMFQFSNGTNTKILGRRSLNKKLKKMRFAGDTSFITIREYSKRL